MTTSSSICAIVVTFQPEIASLRSALLAIGPQVEHVLVVDNGSRPGYIDWLGKEDIPGLQLLLLGENKGVATAINQGVAWAIERRCSHVLLLDQDSLPAPDMVAQLVRAESPLRGRGVRIAVLGPQAHDPRFLKPLPFIRMKKWALGRYTCQDDSEIREVDYLITSGSLVPISALAQIGGMREDLFIDYVDIEWGLRAGAQGFKCFGVCAAKMLHSLGDRPVTAFSRWRVIPMRSPLRHYYHFRNALALYRETRVPMQWKLQDGTRLVLRFLFYCLFAVPHMAHWKMMTLGLWHGVTGRMGRYG
jgi:rhamnosyltransferase